MMTQKVGLQIKFYLRKHLNVQTVFEQKFDLHKVTCLKSGTTLNYSKFAQIYFVQVKMNANPHYNVNATLL